MWISIIDYPAVLIDGNLPADLREVVVDRITTELKNENWQVWSHHKSLRVHWVPKRAPWGPLVYHSTSGIC